MRYITSLKGCIAEESYNLFGPMSKAQVVGTMGLLILVSNVVMHVSG